MGEPKADRYRHRTESRAWPEGRGLVFVSLCGKVWTPIVAGSAARRYPPCPTCYAKPSRKRVIA